MKRLIPNGKSVKDAPLCKCGCGEYVGWNKQRRRWNIFCFGHSMTRPKQRLIADNEEAPFCACGCGERVVVSKTGKQWNKYVIGHRQGICMRERLANPEFRQMLSDKAIERWKDPEYRQLKTEQARKQGSTPEAKARSSKVMLSNWEKPEFREKIIALNSVMMKERWKDPEYSHKMRVAASETLKKRHQNPQYAQGFKDRGSAVFTKLWQDPGFREMRSRHASKTASKMWSDPRQRERKSQESKDLWANDKEYANMMSEQMKNLNAQWWQDPKYRKMVSDRTYKLWSDPDTRLKMMAHWDDPEFIERWLDGMGRCPNKLENLVLGQLPKGVRYTGDGAWWRKLPNGKYKNPDFKVTGKNKVIEIYGDYWHRNDDPFALMEMYWRVGIECLVIWEHEIYNDINRVMDVVANFIDDEDKQLPLPA